MTQHIVHRLVGYDRATERLAFERDIPSVAMNLVKDIARVERGDVDAVGSYPLTREQARQIAEVAGAGALPVDMAFFLEPFAIRPGKDRSAR